MEVEVKVKLDGHNLEEVKKRLIERGAVFSPQVTHQDAYFMTPGYDERVSGPGEFILRIRKVSGKSILTFKELTEIRGAWIEHETEINDPQAMEKILLSSGFVSVFDINKTRETGKLGEFELCLDNVKELGKFMEVGLISDEHENTRERIINFVKDLGFSDSIIETRGYGEIMGEKLGHKFGGMR